MKTKSRCCWKLFSVSVHCVLVVFIGGFSPAQTINTVAGGWVGDHGPATSAGLEFPESATFDSRGNMYIGDNSRIRKVDLRGNISTITGNGICGYGGDLGLATKAQICGPGELLVDRNGNIIFSDVGNQRIREIDNTGVIRTIAGSGTAGFCGDGGLAINACLNSPVGIVLVGNAATGFLFIADVSNNRIRKLNFSTGTITTAAGSGTAGYSGDGGQATRAQLNQPWSVAYYSGAHSLWISDTANNVVRMVNTTSGIITTFFGTGTCGSDLKSICGAMGLSADGNGDLYIADGNQRVLEVVSGSSSAIWKAGTGMGGFNGDGILATSALLANPASIAFDNNGNLVIVDSGNNRIRSVSSAQLISTIAGGWVGDQGPATKSDLNADFFTGMAWDSSGNMYFADTGNFRVRRISTTGTITTFAGIGITGSSGNGGFATTAEVSPEGVAAFGGNVYITDFNSVRRVDSSGIIIGWAEQLPGATGITADAKGNLYVTSFVYCVVWKIDPNAITTIVAGEAFQCGYNGDGIPATQAELSFPTGVAVDATGNLYIADWFNNRIRFVDTTGQISTFAGNGTCGFSGDGGKAKSAMVCSPMSVSYDNARNILYIADFGNFRVRKIAPGGIISTFAGTGSAGYNGDGLPALQTNMYPTAVAGSPGGIQYIFDLASQRLRKIH